MHIFGYLMIAFLGCSAIYLFAPFFAEMLAGKQAVPKEDVLQSSASNDEINTIFNGPINNYPGTGFTRLTPVMPTEEDVIAAEVVAESSDLPSFDEPSIIHEEADEPPFYDEVDEPITTTPNLDSQIAAAEEELAVLDREEVQQPVYVAPEPRFEAPEPEEKKDSWLDDNHPDIDSNWSSDDN